MAKTLHLKTREDVRRWLEMWARRLERNETDPVRVIAAGKIAETMDSLVAFTDEASDPDLSDDEVLSGFEPDGPDEDEQEEVDDRPTSDDGPPRNDDGPGPGSDDGPRQDRETPVSDDGPRNSDD